MIARAFLIVLLTSLGLGNLAAQSTMPTADELFKSAQVASREAQLRDSANRIRLFRVKSQGYNANAAQARKNFEKARKDEVAHTKAMNSSDPPNSGRDSRAKATADRRNAGLLVRGDKEAQTQAQKDEADAQSKALEAERDHENMIASEKKRLGLDSTWEYKDFQGWTKR